MLALRSALPLCLVAAGLGSLAQAQVQGVHQDHYIKASNTGAGDFFGHAVAISGDTMVIGAEVTP